MQEPSEETVHGAAEAATTRTPGDSDVGMFVCDDWNWGVGLFHWFETQDEMLHFIREYLPYVNAEECNEEDGATRMRRVGEALSAMGATLSDSARGQINETLAGGSDVQWWGTFASLQTESSEFARRVREQFHGEDEDDEDSGRPISETERGDFVEFVQGYGF